MQAYAATDAYAGLLIYNALLKLSPEARHPPPSHFAWKDANACIGHEDHKTDLANVCMKLGPAKRRVYALWQDHGLSLSTISLQRGIQLSTTASYLADAMKAGLPYSWKRVCCQIDGMGIPTQTVAAVHNVMQAAFAASVAASMASAASASSLIAAAQQITLPMPQVLTFFKNLDCTFLSSAPRASENKKSGSHQTGPNESPWNLSVNLYLDKAVSVIPLRIIRKHAIKMGMANFFNANKTKDQLENSSALHIDNSPMLQLSKYPPIAQVTHAAKDAAKAAVSASFAAAVAVVSDSFQYGHVALCVAHFICIQKPS